MTRRGWLLFATMGLIWGVPYLLIKVAVDELSPASVVFWRCALAAVLLAPIAAMRGELRPVLRRWRPLVAFTAIEFGLPWLLLCNAERRLSSSLTGLLLATIPLLGALFGWLSHSERLGPRRLFGLGIGLAGVVALVGLDLGAGDSWALVQMALVAVGYSYGPFILAKYLSDLPRLGITVAALGLAALAYLPVGVVQLPSRWPSGQVIGAVLLLALLCTAAAFLCFFALVDEVGPVRSTVVTYINPAVAVLLGVVLLDESFTVGIAIGFVLILAGSVLAAYRRAPVDGPPAAPPADRVPVTVAEP